MTNWVACPLCGERIDAKAKFCKYCGSDDHTGWSDSTEGAVDWNDDQDYADNLEAEFGSQNKAKGRNAIPLWIKVVAVALALLFGIQLLRSLG
jgi:hypothetical protein